MNAIEAGELFDKSETTSTAYVDEYREKDYEFMTREQFIEAVKKLEVKCPK